MLTGDIVITSARIAKTPTEAYLVDGSTVTAVAISKILRNSVLNANDSSNRASSTEEGERKGEVKLVAPNWLYPMLGIAARHAVPFAFAGFTPRTRHCSPERASALPLSSFHSTKVLWSFGVCALEAINEEHDSRDFQRTRVKSLL